MTKKNTAVLLGYVLTGIGLLATARFTTFSYGLREFFLGLLMGCVGTGLVFGGLSGALHAISPPVIYSDGNPMAAAQPGTPLAAAKDVAVKLSFTFIGLTTVLCAVGAVLLLPFAMLGGCCH